MYYAFKGVIKSDDSNADELAVSGQRGRRVSQIATASARL